MQSLPLIGTQKTMYMWNTGLRGTANERRCNIIMHYLDADSINSVLSGQDIQRLKVESEKRIMEREYNSYQLMRSMIGYMLLRNSLDMLGVKYSYLFYKEIKGYKAPIPILMPHSLIISSTSKARIKNRIIRRKNIYEC